jgi:mRNA-degrading endonuclease RelE of RelBE toxin-antitoxin system
MPKPVIWSGQSRAELRAIEKATALRILHSLARLLSTGEGDVERLRDIDPPEFRLRVADYRIRFHDLSDSIEILSVKHRREAYR